MEATILLHNASLEYQFQLARVLELRADWAASHILSRLSPDQAAEAERIVLASKRHKQAKRDLLSELKKPAR